MTRLALELFDALEQVHGLDGEARYILCLAGMLHDIGQADSYAGHHKRSRDRIVQVELPGVTAAQRMIAAQVARYHRKKTPRMTHSAYAALPAGERARVRRLAALLRIADGCDREHVDRVQRLRACVEPLGIRLELNCRGGMLPVMEAVLRKARLFEQEFDMRVHVEIREPDDE